MKKQLRDFFKFAENLKNVTSLKSKTNRNILFLFVILSGVLVQAQGPGCPNVNAGPDVTLDCDDSCTELTASFLNTGETSDYEATSIPYDPPFPFTGGTPVSVNTDDVWSETIPLPFEFCFYGENYTEFLIGSNGVMTFDTVDNEPGGFCDWSFSESVPNPNLISAAIFGAYMDIDPSVGGSGTINYAFFGEAPCRTLVVNFPSIPYFSCNNQSMTSQIVIYETTNVVEVYMEERTSGCSWNSGNAIIGLQNVGGTQGIAAPDRNTGDWSASQEAWRFTPSGESNVDFVWLDADGVEIATTTTIEVCPTQTSDYTAQATYTLCNGEVIVETDTVTVTVDGAISLDLGSDQSFCDVSSFEIIPSITGADPSEVSYLWSTGETSPTITVSSTGTYSLEVTFENCTVTDTINLEFNESPILNLEGDLETCFESEVLLDATPTNAPVEDATFVWTFNGEVLPETDPIIEAVDFGNYTVVVTVGECSTEFTVIVGPRGDLEVTLGDDITGCTTEQVTLTANTSEEGVSYQWLLNGDVIEEQSSSSITITLPATVSNMADIYTVIITKGDCTGSAEIEARSLNCIISEGLSPGGSGGLNDNLDLEFLANRSGIESLQIFNRHGRIVFEQNNYVNEWFGQTDEGDELPTGTYFYVINFSTEDSQYGNQKTGWIYINRDSN